jgi:hypothetical protein
MGSPLVVWMASCGGPKWVVCNCFLGGGAAGAQKRVPTHAPESQTNCLPTYPWIVRVQQVCLRVHAARLPVQEGYMFHVNRNSTMLRARHHPNFTPPPESTLATLQCGWLGRSALNGRPSCVWRAGSGGPKWVVYNCFLGAGCRNVSRLMLPNSQPNVPRPTHGSCEYRPPISWLALTSRAGREGFRISRACFRTSTNQQYFENYRLLCTLDAVRCDFLRKFILLSTFVLIFYNLWPVCTICKTIQMCTHLVLFLCIFSPVCSWQACTQYTQNYLRVSTECT